MYINIRKEEVKGLPKRYQERGVKLFPRVALDFHGKYEQTWKFNNEGNYSRAKREHKWKYKIYLCGSYRAEGKARNKQILLKTIYYWDIVDNYINADKKQKEIFNIDQNKYDYYDFNESWLELYVFEDMSEEVFSSIREWIYKDDKPVQRILCGMITEKLKNDIKGIEEDYKTTSEYKINIENKKVIENCIQEVEWLNEKNGFK